MNSEKPKRRFLLLLASALLLAVSASTMGPALRQRFSARSGAPLAEPALALLAARPYALEQAYTSYDRAERPLVNSGWVLVLRVPPQLGQLRNGLMPVLCVGPTTAERWNSGGPSGQIVVSVPCELDAGGEPLIELASAPIWFASPELPERVDAVWLAQARATADPLQPFSQAEVQAALRVGGATLHAIDHSDLGRQLAQWIEHYSPEESEYAESLRTSVQRQ